MGCGLRKVWAGSDLIWVCFRKACSQKVGWAKGTGGGSYPLPYFGSLSEPESIFFNLHFYFKFSEVAVVQLPMPGEVSLQYIICHCFSGKGLSFKSKLFVHLSTHDFLDGTLLFGVQRRLLYQVAFYWRNILLSLSTRQKCHLRLGHLDWIIWPFSSVPACSGEPQLFSMNNMRLVGSVFPLGWKSHFLFHF